MRGLFISYLFFVFFSGEDKRVLFQLRDILNTGCFV